MKIDYSLITSILNNDVESIKKTNGYKAINFHAELTGNDYSISGVLEKSKQFENRIMHVMDWLRFNEGYVIETVIEELTRVFGDSVVVDIALFPSVGYDIGIGLNKTVVIDLTNPLFETDVEELITLFIHEAAHTVFETIHGSVKDGKDWSFSSPEAVMDVINYCIYYEGIGVFAAANYRTHNKLTNETHPLMIDYITYNKPQYEEVYKELIFEKDKDLALEKAFGNNRFVHRYGYEIVRDAYEQSGIEEVKRIIHMGLDQFIKEFLIHQGV